jgi:molecular chaperone GrpE
MTNDPTRTDPAADAPEVRMDAEAGALLEKVIAERDEAVEGRKRALADFVNFQRRASENEQRAVRQGVVQVARNLIPALDQFDLSLLQAPATLTVEQLLKAIEMTRNELVRTLERSGIERIAPAAGDEFQPAFHEAVMRQAVAELPPNVVANCFQPGYRLGDVVLRPAKIAVTPE